jgi:hypothetical protein
MFRNLLATLLVAAITSSVTLAPAQEMPEMPKPQKEHEWLKQLVGEWNYEAEFTPMPGQPGMNTSGTEVTRPIGGFWTLTEIKGDMMGMPFQGIMTIGYSPEKQKYIGTWIDNMTSKLLTYEGAVDESGKILTLNTQGPCPMQGGQIVDMQQTIEFKNPDEQVTTSRSKNNGEWVTNMTVTSRRKK